MSLPKTITPDQGAESGGTAGMFAAGVKSGKIKIVDDEDLEVGVPKIGQKGTVNGRPVVKTASGWRWC